MSRIGIIGYGSFGTALSVLLSKKDHEVRVAARNAQQLNMVSETRENTRYLKGITIPQEVKFFGDDYGEAVSDASIVLFAVPSQSFRENLMKAIPFVPRDAILVNVAKGIEQNTNLRLSQIAEEIAPNHSFVTLSGPSHAEEVGENQPTSVVAASLDPGAAKTIQEEFMTDRFRIYTNGDIIGVEIAGALKNIMALGAGISQGLGFGDNAKAAMMTRGIVEISRLGMAMGANMETFAGLAGIGDLIVTCTSMHSRNLRCGNLIGRGKSVEDAVNEIGMVVEGIYSCNAAYELAKKYSVEMPITETIMLCLKGEIEPLDAITRLMNRAPKDEGDR